VARPLWGAAVSLRSPIPASQGWRKQCSYLTVPGSTSPATGDRLERAHRLDVADRAAVAALPQAVVSEHGRVDLLFNNAGVALSGTFDQISETGFDWLFDINFRAVVRLTRAFLPYLRAGHDAPIVNISSLLGLISPPGQTAYSASKFAVRGFSNALRFELMGGNAGVTVVHPGGVATKIAENSRRHGVPPTLRWSSSLSWRAAYSLCRRRRPARSSSARSSAALRAW
jgi:NAD(P)-dependent dehydrogenase (short-subunit alcohol dehydrogenase family)